MKKKAYVLETPISCTLNCNNAVRLSDYLKANGYDIVSDSRNADLIVYSGCGFAIPFELLALSDLMDLHEVAKSTGAKVVATGCLPWITKHTKGTLNGQSFKDIHSGIACSKPDMHLLDKEINAQVPFDSIPYPFDISTAGLEKVVTENLSHFLPSFMGRLLIKPSMKVLSMVSREEHSIVLRKKYALIVPGEGCKNGCSYCCIKFAKQNPKSVPADVVVARIREALEKGAKGIFIMPDDLGSWGKDLGQDWCTLLEQIYKIEGDFPIVIYNLNAYDLTEKGDIFDPLLKKRRLTCMGSMMQHVHPEVLKRMNRQPLDVARYRQRLERLLENGARITLHAIVGFPGETEDEFMALYSFLEQLPKGPIELLAFPYSKREGTSAAINLREIELPLETIRGRYKMVRDLWKDRSLIQVNNFMGSPLFRLAFGSIGRRMKTAQ